MNSSLRSLLCALAALAALAGCSKIKAIDAPVARSGSADFSRPVAIGTSISAGFQSNGIVDRHQTRAFPVLFARQAGTATFTIPTIGDGGYEPLLRLVSLSPLVISSAGVPEGVPTNGAQITAYHNMGVPGALLLDVPDSSLYHARGVVQSTRFDYIVRHRGTMLSEAMSLAPTFITFEIGANEVIGPALGGSGTPVLSGPAFGGLLHNVLDSLAARAPDAEVAIFTVPDVTSIPFFTTISRFLNPTGTCVAIGSAGPLQAGDLVTLGAGALLAAGTGVPIPCGGNGNPLPDQVVLTAAEVTSIQAAVTLYNAAILTEAAARGYAVVDLNGLLRRASTTGFEIQGTTYTTKFVTGGLISLDGVHPNDLAHGLLANALIDAVNAKFGASVPHVNLAAIASITASSQHLARGETAGLPQIADAERMYREMFPWR
jgi:lysophospholipase L1-like esterase